MSHEKEKVGTCECDQKSAGNTGQTTSVLPTFDSGKSKEHFDGIESVKVLGNSQLKSDLANIPSRRKNSDLEDNG